MPNLTALKCLSYDVTVIQRITCHKNCMIKHVIILSCTQHFPNEIMFILKAINNHFKGLYDEQNLTLWSFHMKFMKLAKGLLH